MNAPQPTPIATLPALTLDTLTSPSERQTERLLALAGRVYQSKPWEKLEEEQIFVVRNPTDDALLFVGTIGSSGEQAGVIVYRGADAYFGLLDFLERASQLPAIPHVAEGLEAADELLSMLADALSQANFDPMELMQLPQLQLMFEPRDGLEAPDEAWITRHKYQATGAGFPTFRGVSSGFLPWWISEQEADVMIVALEQLLEIVGRKNFSPDGVEIREIETSEDFALELFARVPTKDANGAVKWSDERLVVDPQNSLVILKNAPDAGQVERIRALPMSRETIEVALLGMSVPFGDAQTRPFFPTLLLLGCEGEVVANEMLQSGFGDALAPQIVRVLVQWLAERPARPQTLQFSSPDLDVLNDIGEPLGIAIEEVEELKTLDPALEELAEQMENFDHDDLSEDELDEDELDELEAGTPPDYPQKSEELRNDFRG